MYIKVGVGNINNKVDFNCANYDYDKNPIMYYDYGTSTVKPIDQSSSSNYGVRSYSILKSDSTEVSDGAICIFSDSTVYSTAPSAKKDELLEKYKNVVEGSGFGVFDDDKDAIISKKIQYTNRISGQGWSSSESNVEYTEVTPTETEPENWEEERLYAYYMGHEVGSGVQVMYQYVQISPSNYDWETLYTFLQNNPAYKLYKNTELSKRIIIGEEDKCVSFNVTKGDYMHGSTYNYPFVGRFVRNTNTTYTSDSGGNIIAGDDPTDVPYQIWKALGSPWTVNGWNYPSTQASAILPPFTDTGRLNSSAPETKSNPVTECTLMQFGRVTYKGKVYVGVWNVTYKSAYYWGYLSTNSADQYNPTSWATLSTTAVTYGADMNKVDHVHEISFFGVCLEDIDIPVDIKDGDIPRPITPGPQGGGAYAYPSAQHHFLETESFGTIAGPTQAGLHVYYLTSDQFDAFSSWVFLWKNGAYRYAEAFSEAVSQDAGDPDTTFFDAILDVGEAFNFGTTLNALKASSVDITSGILFCRKMPVYVSSRKVDQNSIGIRVSGVSCNTVTPSLISHERIVDTITYEFSKDSSGTSWQTGTYFDISPYVTAKLFLPYYGDISLPVDAFMGGSIQVRYYADVISGKGAVHVITKDKNGEQTSFGPYECDICVEIPLVVADSNANNRISAITHAAASTSLSALSGNVAGAAIGGITGLLDATMQPKTQQMITSFGSGIAYLTPFEIKLQLTYPQTLEDKKFDGEEHNLDATMKNIGCTSYQNGTVSEFLNDGKLTKYSYVDTDGISYATEGEKREIERLMREGVY